MEMYLHVISKKKCNMVSEETFQFVYSTQAYVGKW